MTTAPDFRLGGLEPADAPSQEAHERLCPEDCVVLREHHATDGTLSHFVLHDGSATWGVPGEPQLISVAVVRDLTAGTFRFETGRHAAVPFAQNWLIQRGCPAEDIGLGPGEFPEPADEATVRIEQQILASGDRYQILATHTDDAADTFESWTLVHDTSPEAVSRPVRLFLEQADLKAGRYTFREGAFTDANAVEEWLFDRKGPLPEPPEHRSTAELHHRAALARSDTAPACRYSHGSPRSRTGGTEGTMSRARFAFAGHPDAITDLRQLPADIRDLALLELQNLVHGSGDCLPLDGRLEGFHKVYVDPAVAYRMVIQFRDASATSTHAREVYLVAAGPRQDYEVYRVAQRRASRNGLIPPADPAAEARVRAARARSPHATRTAPPSEPTVSTTPTSAPRAATRRVPT